MGKAVRLNGMVKNPFNMSIRLKKRHVASTKGSRASYISLPGLSSRYKPYPTELSFCEPSYKGRAANQAVCLHIDLSHADFVDSQVFLMNSTALCASIRCEKHI